MKGIANYRQIAWLAFAVAALFLFLGTRGLNEPDEGRYAEIAREMTVTGDWLVPHLNGIEHFQKPPLLYWLTAASMRVFGANEWGARLPSALAALGVVVLTYGIARRLFDRNAAVAATLVLVSSIEFFALARLLTPDMLLTFWITAAIAALVYHRGWLFFVCMGFGFLTKGPMALVVPISGAIGWQLAAPPDSEKLTLPWVRGLALTLVIGLSWFVCLSLRDGVLFDYFWRYELVERVASSTHGRSKPVWFFLPILLVGFLPWIFFLPERARDIWMRWRNGEWSKADLLLLFWIVPPLLVLSFSGSKLPTYILPLYPALSLLVARSVRVQALQWRVAIPCSCCWMAGAALLPLFNDSLKQQASVRALAENLERQTDATQAEVFACEVRAHGFDFYLRRLVSATRDQSDIVLPASISQQKRLFESPESLEEAFANRKSAYGIVRRQRFERTFGSHGWIVLAKAGDFYLISNRSSPQNSSGYIVAHRMNRGGTRLFKASNSEAK
jgi:4-amino-4-deoxy-L-arabinose transferase-like glycosyltransferase